MGTRRSSLAALEINMADIIDGVVIKKLRQIVDERGKIMHMMRADSQHHDS